MIGYKITIPGKPQSQPRHRHGRGRTWDPAAKAKKDLATVVKSLIKEKFSGPVELEVRAFYGRKNAWVDIWIRSSGGRPKRPDADNIAKFYMDMLSGIAYDDDNQVAQLRVSKSDNADLHPDVGSEITIEEVEIAI